jgi:predicted PurR-regulated permease PerM
MAMTEIEDKAQHTRDLQLGPRDRLRAFVLLAFTIAGIYVCFRLLLPFLPALVWALALAIVFVPAHRWVEAKLSNANFAAAISVVLIGLLVVAPVLLVSSRVIESAATGASIIRDEFASAEWLRVLENNKLPAPLARWIAQADFRSVVENVTSWLTTTSASFVSGSVWGLITFLVTFYLLFYFLRDRAAGLSWLQEISPLSGLEMDRLFGRVADTVEATLYGTVVVAVLQGALGGLIFWWLELPTPVFWGLVMGLLAVVPVLGAFVVWVPAAIFLALSGDWTKGLILTAWGTIVVGGIHLLYPILVRDRLRLHTIPAFISIVGGLILFGASGLLLGPLSVTATMFLLEVWRVPITGPDQ